MTREEAINEIKSWAIPSKKGREVLETLIPELRESEDEKIRKDILRFLKAKLENCTAPTPAKSTLSIWIDFLEKQKEQNHDGKKWIYEDDYDKDIERSFNEGKDEVLENPEKYGLQKEQKPIEDVVKDITKNKESAIKFLKSAGIMDDNGELAEIYRSEQKPADYDHEMWKNCEANFEGGKKEVIDHPEKYGLQKLAEWSEEDKDYYDTIVRKLEVIGDDSGLSDNQIKFLREHCPLHRSEWNEEDETIIEGACSALEIYGHTKLAERLKFLRPQSHWKPSKEQMEALETAERWYSDNMGCNFALVSLCEQLKKL